ncbi:MAG TPA: LemA family protein [Dehalococcoidales bacterium]|nr:LemA family protein [Dehalococcoidales bacterium]
MNSRIGCFAVIGGLVLLILILGGLVWANYNSLVTKSQAVDSQWAQVETQYQRRFDLIPNLVESVKGYMTQEKEIFTQIAEARSRYSGAVTPDQRAAAGSEVESALGRLLVIMENYPELKSVQPVTQLMDELAGTENRINVERMRYNDQVRDYNTTIKRFPTNFLASLFNFNAKTYFQSEEGASQVPKVDFKK